MKFHIKNLCFFIMCNFFLPQVFGFKLLKKSYKETTECEFYNGTDCNQNDDSCKKVELCGHQGRRQCFVLWSTDSNGTDIVKMKGCFLNNVECYNQELCIGRSEKAVHGHYFCCCEGSLCNRNYTWDPISESSDTPSEPLFVLVIKIIIGITVTATILGTLYVYFACRKKNVEIIFNEITEDKIEGEFGTIWRAHYKANSNSVQVYSIESKQAWLTEKLIYRNPHSKIPEFLRYVSIAVPKDDLQKEFRLVTGFLDKGSLCHYLKENVVDWNELWKIVESVAKGLKYLHDEEFGPHMELLKPSIAHRDFKSENILINNDMTISIVDFGLALVIEPTKLYSEPPVRVGTKRYMAPEVLDCAINRRRDAIVAIDMYACALVIWELLSRCSASCGPVSEYKLPYEEELGKHPTLKEMKDFVFIKNQRPVLQEIWKHHPGLAFICRLMEESWDEDPDARLTSSYVVEQMKEFRAEHPDLY